MVSLPNLQHSSPYIHRWMSSHRGENEFSGEIDEGSQACGQVDALRAAPQTVVEDLDEVLQAVLVHGVDEGQVSHDKV